MASHSGSGLDLLSRVKAFFSRDQLVSSTEAANLSRLPPDERLARLGVVLHELCVKAAARFVEEQQRRPDSPFVELPKSDLFHEMLVMNFWLLERLFKGRRIQLMNRIYGQYATSFVWGRESSHQELTEALQARFRAYDASWNDYSGHQDVFARRVIDVIFGDRKVTGAAQAAFWLISYADRTTKEFSRVEKSVALLLVENTGQD